MRGQIDATHELITINTDMLKILREQYQKGYASQLDVAAQESQLAQVLATLPPLLKQLAQQRDLLAVLAGGFPSQDLTEKFELANLQLPRELPLSLPSQLVEQRPDVRQAEENLHSASAQIGIAVANRLPSFALTADAGSSPVALSKMFSEGNGFWDLGAGVTQPIFDAGTLRHRERAAQAAFTAGRRTISQHGPDRLSKCRGHPACARIRTPTPSRPPPPQKMPPGSRSICPENSIRPATPVTWLS